jgi:predicted amidohydrolase
VYCAVFDEDRCFGAGKQLLVFSLDGAIVGVNICEDIWYPAGPTKAQAPPGVRITPCAFGKDQRLPITNQYREG